MCSVISKRLIVAPLTAAPGVSAITFRCQRAVKWSAAACDVRPRFEEVRHRRTFAGECRDVALHEYAKASSRTASLRQQFCQRPGRVTASHNVRTRRYSAWSRALPKRNAARRLPLNRGKDSGIRPVIYDPYRFFFENAVWAVNHQL
jgi:hypothetical protein